MFAGFSLGLLTGIGFYFTYHKLPPRIRKFVEKHHLLTEIITTLLAYWTLGGTLTALFAAAWLGIIESLFFWMMSNPTSRCVIDQCMRKLKKVVNNVKIWILEQMEEFKEEEECKETI